MKKKFSFDDFCGVAESIAAILGLFAVGFETVGKIPEAKESFKKLKNKVKEPDGKEIPMTEESE